jgi:hypothetical protein
MDASESRLTTIACGCVAVASIAFFVAIYAPTLASVAPGEGVLPWSTLPLLAMVFGAGGWIPCIVMGLRQLFVRPRRYGIFTLGIGILQIAAFRLTEWLLMGSRGIYWAG